MKFKLSKNFFTSTPFFILLFFVLVLLFIIVPILSMLYESRNDVPILVYHDVVDNSDQRLNVTTEEFKEQMEYLKDAEYSVISLDKLMQSWQNGDELPEDPVVLTFDGGYSGVYSNAFPILQEKNFPATVFLTIDDIGINQRHITWEQVAQMMTSGLIDFESNTLSRQAITRLGTENHQRYSLSTSKQTIEWKLHSTVKYVSYPLGVYDVNSLQLSRAAGYKAGFTIEYGFAKNGRNNFVYDRIPIFENGSSSLLRFKIRLKFAPFVQEFKSLKDTLTSGGYEFLSNLIPVP